MALTEKFVKTVYNELSLHLKSHNHIVESKSMWKWCLSCKQKALTISQPIDHVGKSRLADYRILCLTCQITEIITGSNYSGKQELRLFIFDLTKRFNLEKKVAKAYKED